MHLGACWRHVDAIHRIHLDGTGTDGCNAGSSCHRTLSLLMFTQDLHMSLCPIQARYRASSLHCIPTQCTSFTALSTKHLYDRQLPYQNRLLYQDSRLRAGFRKTQFYRTRWVWTNLTSNKLQIKIIHNLIPWKVSNFYPKVDRSVAVKKKRNT